MDQGHVGTRSPPPERHLERVEHECGAHVRGELPAHHAAAVGVEHEGEEHQPLPASEVGEIGDPELVRRAG
jgi:hypothetical protein